MADEIDPRADAIAKEAASTAQSNVDTAINDATAGVPTNSEQTVQSALTSFNTLKNSISKETHIGKKSQNPDVTIAFQDGGPVNSMFGATQKPDDQKDNVYATVSQVVSVDDAGAKDGGTVTTVARNDSGIGNVNKDINMQYITSLIEGLPEQSSADDRIAYLRYMVDYIFGFLNNKTLQTNAMNRPGWITFLMALNMIQILLNVICGIQQNECYLRFFGQSGNSTLKKYWDDPEIKMSGLFCNSLYENDLEAVFIGQATLPDGSIPSFPAFITVYCNTGDGGALLSFDWDSVPTSGSYVPIVRSKHFDGCYITGNVVNIVTDTSIPFKITNVNPTELQAGSREQAIHVTYQGGDALKNVLSATLYNGYHTYQLKEVNLAQQLGSIYIKYDTDEMAEGQYLLQISGVYSTSITDLDVVNDIWGNETGETPITVLSSGTYCNDITIQGDFTFDKSTLGSDLYRLQIEGTYLNLVTDIGIIDTKTGQAYGMTIISKDGNGKWIVCGIQISSLPVGNYIAVLKAGSCFSDQWKDYSTCKFKVMEPVIQCITISTATTNKVSGFIKIRGNTKATQQQISDGLTGLSGTLIAIDNEGSSHRYPLTRESVSVPLIHVFYATFSFDPELMRNPSYTYYVYIGISSFGEDCTDSMEIY